MSWGTCFSIFFAQNVSQRDQCQFQSSNARQAIWVFGVFSNVVSEFTFNISEFSRGKIKEEKKKVTNGVKPMILNEEKSEPALILEDEHIPEKFKHVVVFIFNRTLVIV